MPYSSDSWNTILTQYGTHIDYRPGVPSTTASYTRLVPTSRSRSTEKSSPSWRENVKRGIGATTGLIAHHTYAHEHFDASSTVISWTDATRTQKYWVETVTGCMLTNMDVPPTTVDPTGSSLALNRALSSLLDDYNAKKGVLFQGAIALGEWEETVRMVESRARAIVSAMLRFISVAIDFLRSLKRGDLRKLSLLHQGLARGLSDLKSLKRLNKKFCDLYLEAMYGWLPLVHDLNDALTALNELAGRVPFVYVHLKGSGKSVTQLGSTISGVQIVPGYWGPTAYNTVVRKTTEVEHRYKFYGMASVHAKDCSAANLMGFDPLRDFLPTVWELIPYSFVVDYFTNLGELIEAQCTRLFNINWLNQGYRGVQRTYYRCIPVHGFQGYIEYSFSGGGGVGKTVNVQRQRIDDPSTVIGRKQLVFKIPKPVQWLNLGALGGSKHFAGR